MLTQEEVSFKPTINDLDITGNNIYNIINNDNFDRTLNFNFSYKDYFKYRRQLGYSGIWGYSVGRKTIYLNFTDLKFNLCYVNNFTVNCNISKEYGGNTFSFESIPSFCGGFRIHSLSQIESKEILNFIFQFCLEEIFGKHSEYSRSRAYPIFFNDKDIDSYGPSAMIASSLSDKNIEGTLTKLNSYTNPNSKNKVCMYMYQIENY